MTDNEKAIATLEALGFCLNEEQPPEVQKRNAAWCAFAGTLTDREFVAVVDALEKCAREEGRN
jgi:hypothetical protein